MRFWPQTLMAEVIKPYLIGRDVNRDVEQSPTRWIIDFGMMTKEEASGSRARCGTCARTSTRTESRISEKHMRSTGGGSSRRVPGCVLRSGRFGMCSSCPP